MNKFLYSDERGQGLAEYGLLLTAVALTAVGILSLLGVQVGDIMCQAAEGLGGEGLCETILFSDGFDNGIDDWHSVFGSRDKWEVTEGDDPELCSRGGGDMLLTNDGSGTDYVVETDANLDSGNGYGIFFRATENESGRVDGYTFQYDPGYQGGQFIMRKWVNGYELWPPFAAAAAPSGYDWHDVERHVEIDVNGDTFTATVDGEQVLTGQDSSYTEGGAGLRFWSGSKACFDDFTVSSR